jgi:sphingosine kinase
VKIWETKARAVFEAANIECETRTTKARGEATDVARGLDASLYDGIVAVGGDGTVAELFQGLSEREDREEIYAKMPIGIVPAGSGNALCKSIQHAGGEPCDPVSCALTIARWRTRALDRSEVRFRDSKTASGWGDDSKVTHSLLSTSWGFFSDVDIESERFRFLGGARFTLQAIVRILARRKYRCELLYETTEEGEAYNAQHCDGPHGEPVSGRPGWRRVAGDVLGLWALNVPWGTETTLAAPHAKFDDGSVDVVLVNVTNRKNMLKLLLDFDAGDHARNRAVRYIKAKSFEIYPGTAAAAAGTAAAAAASVDPSSETHASAPGGGGYIAVDGEVLASRRFRGAAAAPFPYGPFRCDVVRAACAVFAPPRA